MVKSVDHFKQFLDGKEFEIKTDHAPLTSFKTKATPSVWLGRSPLSKKIMTSK